MSRDQQNDLRLDLMKRLKIYAFLAMAFYEPNLDLVRLLTDDKEWVNIVSAARDLCGAAEKLIKTLPAAFGGENKSIDLSLGDLQAEYTRLFLGPLAPPCPPYESVYQQNRQPWQDGTILGPAAMAMDELLRSLGLSIVLDYQEYADHIAIELEMMYYLLSKDAVSCSEHKTDSKAANEFLRARLLPWLPAFGEKLTQEAKQPFYAGLGQLLAAFIRAEGERYA